MLYEVITGDDRAIVAEDAGDDRRPVVCQGVDAGEGAGDVEVGAGQGEEAGKEAAGRGVEKLAPIFARVQTGHGCKLSI